ncbi:hypothetical protein HT102_00220 [Hoyosella sp. G463]|uniref:Uncharacterized protein n=1 Tax=Lolliginicoccus lacisalsi TaxID=2742202 RepID=A0A927J906_9ACTN|nr:hypothetical protein [Lolliginicoccus lacisalsi]MBD8504911.1 hypothetical protein [Lolliginicoccus lacisalsi]
MADKKQERPERPEPTNTVDALKHIAQTSLDKSGDIVEGSTDMLRGNVSGGIGRIIKSATDIATTSAGKGARILTQQFPDEEEANAKDEKKDEKKDDSSSRSSDDKQ